MHRIDRSTFIPFELDKVEIRCLLNIEVEKVLGGKVSEVDVWEKEISVLFSLVTMMRFFTVI